MIPIITIEGATATGKSSLAIELASLLGTDIISADSRQVYRYMDIGTAKVSKQDREAVTHHLVDIINPDQTYNAGMFCSDAKAIISSLTANGSTPIVCGGTGLYVRSLLNGLCALPMIPESIRKELEMRHQTEGQEALYNELVSIDPEAAAKISANDPQRTIRALEVYLATEVPLSEHWHRQQKAEQYKAFRIMLDLPRDLLYARINDRLKTMVKEGLLAEIQNLFKLGYTEADPGLNCMGYKEFIPYLKGQSSLADCCEYAAQHQRNLAKRQLTWYRKCSFDLTLDAREVSIYDISEMIKDFLIEAGNADNSQST